MRRLAIAVACVGALAASCGGDDGDAAGTGDTTGDTSAALDTTTTTAGDGGGDVDPSGTLRVPDDFATIQAAVDAAEPGALILVAPGTYNEEVNVTTDGLTIRGLDRAGVVLDGEFELENGVRALEADGVVVENLTTQNYTRNGVFFTGVDGYRASYINAIRNGDYGIYAFGSINGVIEHSYAAGSPDAGVYIGQCFECNAVIDDVISEFNGLGYSGTNSGGDLYIVNSTFRNNRAGIVPNSGSYEGCAPERQTTIVGNIVHSNNNGDTAAIDAARLAQGNGILVTGGIDNVIERNLVFDHDIGGIAIVPFPEDDPIAPIPEVPPVDCTADAEAAPPDVQATTPNPLYWFPAGNRVVGNDVSDSRQFDLVVIAGPEYNNCFSDNTVTITSPVGLQDVAPCGGTIQPYDADFAGFLALVEAEKPESADFREVELPALEEQPNMDDPEGTPASPQVGEPTYPDVAAIALPARPS